MSYAGGSKVVNAVTDTAVSASAHDDADTELATILGPRDIQLPVAGARGVSNWTCSTANDPTRWVEGAQANEVLRVDLPVHSGMVIDEILLHLGGNAAGTETIDGEIVIYRCQIDTGATKSSVAVLDNTDPWQLGGASVAPAAFTGLGITIAGGYQYWLELASVGDGSADCYHYGSVLVDVQLDA